MNDKTSPVDASSTDTTASHSHPHGHTSKHTDWDRLVRDYDADYSRELETIYQLMPRYVPILTPIVPHSRTITGLYTNSSMAATTADAKPRIVPQGCKMPRVSQ